MFNLSNRDFDYTPEEDASMRWESILGDFNEIALVQKGKEKEKEPEKNFGM